MTARPTSEVEIACQRLVVEFAHHLDHRRFEDVAALFAADGVWSRHGEDLVGPTQILELLRRRPESQLERHVMTTIHITQSSDMECSSQSYALIFRAGTEPGGSQAGPTLAVGEFHDRFRLTTSGWRFVYRTSVPVFSPGAVR